MQKNKKNNKKNHQLKKITLLLNPEAKSFQILRLIKY